MPMFWHHVRDGSLTKENIRLFLDRKDPFDASSVNSEQSELLRGKEIEEWALLMKEFWLQVDNHSFTRLQFEALLNHRNPFENSDTCREWMMFYSKYFGISPDLSDIDIPDDPGGFKGTVIIPKGLTLSRAYPVLCKMYPNCMKLDELRKSFGGNDVTNDRIPNRNYAIRVRGEQASDRQLIGYDVQALDENKKICITLLERIIFGIKWCTDSGGEHLDVETWTLCAGTRNSDGQVPVIYWFAGLCGEVVSWYDKYEKFTNKMRAREVIV